MKPTADAAFVDLYWLPLGAGGRLVRRCGALYERVSAGRAHRPVADLLHAALLVRCDQRTYAVEMGPVWNVPRVDRGVVASGAVGASWLGRFRAFQYEVRCWPGGVIPDLAHAADAPIRLSTDPAQAARLVEVLATVPTHVWGRDPAQVGEMWNSNSVVAWALVRSGHDLSRAALPAGGRAPGWRTGVALAARPG